jgi:DNA-binding GntR family transcriptional regulator
MSISGAGPTLAPVAEAISRTDLIVDAIRAGILRGDLQPGEALVERELAARLGVSKTPIREALKVLARSGLVTISPFRGAQVREVHPELARSIYEVRMLLEPEAVRLSLASQDNARIAEARAILRDARIAAERSDFTGLSVENRRFHRLIYAHSGNDILTGFLDEVQDQVALIATVAWRRRRTWGKEASEHAAIIDALEAANGELAAQLVKLHITGSLASLSQVLADAESA